MSPLPKRSLLLLTGARGDRSRRVVGQTDLLTWYRAMAPVWFGVEPPRRRVLILLVHGWVIDRVIHRLIQGRPPPIEELGPAGRLAGLLRHFDATAETETWVRALVVGLHEALARLATDVSERNVRSLFLVPYWTPYPARGPASEEGGRALRRWPSRENDSATALACPLPANGAYQAARPRAASGRTTANEREGQEEASWPRHEPN